MFFRLRCQCVKAKTIYRFYCTRLKIVQRPTSGYSLATTQSHHRLSITLLRLPTARLSLNTCAVHHVYLCLTLLNGSGINNCVFY